MPYNVLIINQDIEAATAIHTVLIEAGYAVIRDDGHNDWLAAIHNVQPDLALLDDRLAGTGGAGTIRDRILQHKEIWSIPVFIFTDDKALLDSFGGHEYSCIVFLDKSISAYDLKEHICRLLHRLASIEREQGTVYDM